MLTASIFSVTLFFTTFARRDIRRDMTEEDFNLFQEIASSHGFVLQWATDGTVNVLDKTIAHVFFLGL